MQRKFKKPNKKIHTGKISQFLLRLKYQWVLSILCILCRLQPQTPCWWHYRASSTYKGSQKTHPQAENALLYTSPTEHRHFAEPTLNVLRTHTWLTAGQNHPSQSLYYNKVLTISPNLLNTVLKAKKNGCMDSEWFYQLFALVPARLTGRYGFLPLPTITKDVQL